MSVQEQSLLTERTRLTFPRQRATGRSPWAASAFLAPAAAVCLGIAVTKNPTFATASLVVALFVLLAIQHPAHGLLLFVATRPLVDLEVSTGAGSVSAGKLWSLGLALAAIHCLTRYHEALEWRLAAFPTAFLAFYAALAAARGDRAFGVQFALRFAVWILVLLAVASVASSARGQLLIIKAGLGGAAMTAAAIAYAIVKHKYGAAYYDYTIGYIIQRPDGFAALGVFSVTFCVLAFILGRLRIVAAVLAVVLSIEVILAYTRTELVALAIVAVGAIVVTLRGRRRSAVLGAIASVGGMGAAVYFARARLGQRFSDLLPLVHGSIPSNAASGRVGFWGATLDGIFASPSHFLVGSGAGASVKYIAERLVVNRGIWAHDDFLELFASGGVVLAAAYVGLFVWLWRPIRLLLRNRQSGLLTRKAALVVASALVAFLAISLFTGAIFSTDESLLFALLGGFVCGLARTPGRTCFDEAFPAFPPTPRSF